MIVYSKKQCPSCDEAKALLTKNNVDFTVRTLDVDFDITELFELCSALEVAPPRSFPMIVDSASVYTLQTLQAKFK